MVIIADGRSGRRCFPHFVRANIHKLREADLEFTLNDAEACKRLRRLLALCVPDSRDIASNTAVNGGARFLMIDDSQGEATRLLATTQTIAGAPALRQERR